jgi:hypothetical protein
MLCAGLHPNYLALSRHAKVRQRQYRDLLVAKEPGANVRDPRWATERAVDSVAFLSPASVHRAEVAEELLYNAEINAKATGRMARTQA